MFLQKDTQVLLKFLGKNNQKRPDRPLLILCVQLKTAKSINPKCAFYLVELSDREKSFID